MDNKTLRYAIDSVRVLSVEAIEKAKSGHPGTPLGAAPAVSALFGRYLRHDPADPAFFDRDRFVLSAGHASSMLYSVLHLCGYDHMEPQEAAEMEDRQERILQGLNTTRQIRD